MTSQNLVDQNENWTSILRPKRGLFDLRLRELWLSRDLIMLFVWRDFVSVYKQTILGPLWYLVQPLLTTIVFTIIFGRIAGLPTEGLPPFLFYMSGTVIWSYFAECLTKTSDTFISNANIFGKVYFPRLTVPISISISNLVSFFIQFLLFLAFISYFWLRGANVQPNYWILLTPLLLVMMAGMGLGGGIIVSSMTTRYRDLRYLVGFGTQLIMYATPVIYPVSAVPEKLQPLIELNPLTPIVESFRYAYLGSGTVSIYNLVYSLVWAIGLMIVGIIIFNKVEATFMDTV
jgi:lipopolysaccharide transport system permease protein